MLIRRYDVPQTPLDEREEWEGYDPECCIEPLQPRQDMPLVEDDMMLVNYGEIGESA
jgi:hypothetical protein